MGFGRPRRSMGLVLRRLLTSLSGCVVDTEGGDGRPHPSRSGATRMESARGGQNEDGACLGNVPPAFPSRSPPSNRGVGKRRKRPVSS